MSMKSAATHWEREAGGKKKNTMIIAKNTCTIINTYLHNKFNKRCGVALRDLTISYVCQRAIPIETWWTSYNSHSKILQGHITSALTTQSKWYSSCFWAEFWPTLSEIFPKSPPQSASRVAPLFWAKPGHVSAPGHSSGSAHRQPSTAKQPLEHLQQHSAALEVALGKRCLWDSESGESQGVLQHAQYSISQAADLNVPHVLNVWGMRRSAQAALVQQVGPKTSSKHPLRCPSHSEHL